MRQIALLFCALILLSSTLRATPSGDFTARGKELLADKGKLSEPDRLHRLFDFSWEYTIKESPEFATSVGYPGQNDRWSDISFEAIARRKETDKLDLELIKSIDRTKLSQTDVISYDLYQRNAEFSVEGVPGHHFQIAIAQEMEDLPEFRKNGGYNAFAEGWALYAESLGYEMGFFKDPYQNFGHLGDEMLRAVRLVVDTGLHSMDWKREQAINYFEENTGNSPHDIEVEVDRYIVWPSQALGYKIGQLKIRELRTYAEKELGQKFDLRAFHDEVLKNGALPLSVLETHMREWVAKGKGA